MKLHEETLGFLVTDLSRKMQRAFEQRIEGSSLTPAQARTLVYVLRHEGDRQVELAELMEVQPVTLARSLDQLAEAGLVERCPDPADRRAYRIHLTPAAAPHLAAIEEVAAAIHADALRGLDAQQAETVFHALRTMRDNLAPRIAASPINPAGATCS